MPRWLSGTALARCRAREAWVARVVCGVCAEVRDAVREVVGELRLSTTSLLPRALALLCMPTADAARGG